MHHLPMRGSGVLVLVAALAGCGGGSHRRPQIGVTLAVDTGADAEDVQRGMRQAAESLGLDLRIVGAGDDAARQAAEIDSFIAGRAMAIVVHPVDANRIADAIARANRSHIPLFTVGDPVDRGPVVSHIGSDDVQGGELVGAYVAQRVHGGGNVAILDQPSVTRVRDPVAGLRAVLARFPNIRIVASPAVDPGSRAAARHRTETLLATDQRIDAVVGTTRDLALGALAAIQAAGRNGAVVVACGGGPEARAAILQGTARVADVVADGVTIGRSAIAVAASHLRGNHVASLVPVPVHLVDHDSLQRSH